MKKITNEELELYATSHLDVKVQSINNHVHIYKDNIRVFHAQSNLHKTNSELRKCVDFYLDLIGNFDDYLVEEGVKE